MINQSTTNKLHEMHMGAMADAFRDQLNDHSFKELQFEERFGFLVDAEWTRRKHNRLQKLIKNACLKFGNASVADIEYHDDRKLDRSEILRLSSGSYIDENRNIIILGASGNGKSWLACAFGIAACQHYFPVRYIRLPELLDELALARGLGTFKKVIRQYKSIRLLILDEWLLTPLREQEARDLLEIVEARCQCASTIFCTQFKPGGWHEKIGQETLADAILDRIVHDSYQIF
ncbi:MAG: IS21-like element helper ATPase IstB, partial [Candidatus Cloacimonadaceae bacterium]|nr:IS21-like element helper ATPase IstB [Candidatus Cloacimonadaceae bacterium]